MCAATIRIDRGAPLPRPVSDNRARLVFGGTDSVSVDFKVNGLEIGFVHDRDGYASRDMNRHRLGIDIDLDLGGLGR